MKLVAEAANRQRRPLDTSRAVQAGQKRVPLRVASESAERPAGDLAASAMSSSRPRRVRFGSILLVFAAAAAVSAQTSGGAIRGTVSDPSGALVPGAAITIEEISTSQNWKLVSSGAGLYNAPDLPVGRYDVTVKAQGFSTAERTNIDVQLGSESVINVQLILGKSEEKAIVASQAAAVDLATSQTGAVNSGEVVRELPLNGRDWTTLAALQPEVSIVRTENAPALSNTRGNRGLGTMMAIGGARPQQSSYLLDGVSVNDYAGGGPASVLGISLGVDAIQEFSVVTSNVPADYGKTSGGVINAVTRAGTNQFHGSLYEFLRNSALDARNFFDGASVPPFKRNQFGGSLSGPIKRQRTFFFFDYEGIRQGLGLTSVDTVPSAQARSGHLVAGEVTVSPLVAPFLAFFPLPNGPIDGDTGTYTLAAQNFTTENFVTSRLDHRFSDYDAVHTTYLFDRGQTTGPDTFDGVLLGTFSQRQTASIQESHTFSPSVIDLTRIGFNRIIAEQVQSLSTINPLADDPSYGFLPGRDVGQISIAGVTAYPGGLGAQGDYLFHYTSYQAYDDLLITRGSHAIRAGAAVERIQSNTLGAGANNGTVSFGSLAGFLTDQPTSFVATIPGTSVPEALRQYVAAAHLQDDWRVLRNLTLNLGVRYEMATVPTDQGDRLGTLVLGSQQLKVGSPYFRNPTWRDLSPRVGAAWDPFGDGKTAVRAAFGRYDVLPLTSQLSLFSVISAPFNVQGSSTSVPGGSFPDGLYQSLAAGGPRADFIQQNPKRSYVLQWNFSIQRQLAPSLLFEAAYAGSHGVHLPLVVSDINTVPPAENTAEGYVWPTPRGSGVKPWPAWGAVTAVMWQVSSDYDALPVRLQKRLSHGLLLQGSYTWSKSLDTGSNSLMTPYTNTVANLPAFDSRLRRAVSDFDVPQNLAVSGTWELPSSRSGWKPFMEFAKGWQLATLLTLSSGPPFTPTIAGDALGLNSSVAYDFPDRLSLAGCGNPVNPGNATDYIKLSCFAAPRPATRLGDAGRNVGRGPGLVDWDASLFKNIRVARSSELFNVQLRFEAFNALNHANFGPPTSTSLQLFTQALAPIPSAGNLTSTSTTSRQLQFALKVLW
jgi:Carboxypeptidase regulatory-like domain